MNFPKELKYTKDHEWVRLEEDGTAVIGITDFAQSELGDIVYVDIDTIDETINGEETFGSIEAVKTVSDLFMPVDGTILELNEAIDDAPEKVNEDPYGEGWIVKIKLNDEQSLDSLLSVEAYKELIGK